MESILVGALSSCQLVEPDEEPTHRITVAVSCGKMAVRLDILLREQNFCFTGLAGIFSDADDVEEYAVEI